MIRVTSHALVRWMERRVGADVEALRTAALESSRQALGSDAPKAIGDADLVEFMEMQKFNLEPMRQRIRDLAAPAVAAGCQTLIFAEGVLVLDGATVVTVLAPGMRPRHREMARASGRICG